MSKISKNRNNAKITVIEMDFFVKITEYKKRSMLLLEKFIQEIDKNHIEEIKKKI